VLILCSDGLSGLVRREEFAVLARRHADPPALCSALIDLANARGGPDNITVVTARFDGEGLTEPDGAEGVGYRVYDVTSSGAQTEETAQLGAMPSDGHTASAFSPERLRNLGLIALLLGVLVLLLAVWR
jgi:serine/threonine protein phosphatase PrpC